MCVCVCVGIKFFKTNACANTDIDRYRHHTSVSNHVVYVYVFCIKINISGLL